ncbi:MAG: Rid family detoxifying hydrolase [Balneolaceae bacterium]|nr:Rid family detoxifying hydrolase [Balneolaceae bacterium]
MRRWHYVVGFLLLGALLWLLLIKLPGQGEPRVGEATPKTVVETDRAPEAIGPYSQGVIAGNTLYLAGQIGLVPETGELAGEGMEAQARQVFRNLQAVCEAGGFGFEDVVSVEVYLADMGHYEAFNKIYAEYFEGYRPARAVTEVSRIPRDALLEIKMTAVK